jgi:hypothetical protein
MDLWSIGAVFYCRRQAADMVDVAGSSLRAITFAQNSAALRFTLTSIAPTPLTSFFSE